MTDDVKAFLKNYGGKKLSFMEVCGTHTAEISHNGIHSMVSPAIKLISGPGCPVCVTVSEYVDRLVELCMEENTMVVSFGDMLRVKGSVMSLSDAKSMGGNVRMVYSPFQALELAQTMKGWKIVFAAVGFETTIPVYALLISEAVEKGIDNIRLLTSLKTMPPVIDYVCRENTVIDGFIAPGHVSVITGSGIFRELAEKYSIPFVVAGFDGENILSAIYTLVRNEGTSKVINLYPSAVSEEGNFQAQQIIDKYFTVCDTAWRGIGIIKNSGLRLRDEYSAFDAGSEGLYSDKNKNSRCRCAEVLLGKINPNECGLYGSGCVPDMPQGACMVSVEGSCYQYYINKRY